MTRITTPQNLKIEGHIKKKKVQEVKYHIKKEEINPTKSCNSLVEITTPQNQDKRTYQEEKCSRNERSHRASRNESDHIL